MIAPLNRVLIPSGSRSRPLTWADTPTPDTGLRAVRGSGRILGGTLGRATTGESVVRRGGFVK